MKILHNGCMLHVRVRLKPPTSRFKKGKEKQGLVEGQEFSEQSTLGKIFGCRDKMVKEPQNNVLLGGL